MTLPNERRNSVSMTESFLKDLCDPTKTPRVPKEIRQQARSCLRHYPSSYHMEQAKRLAPTIFGEWDSEFTEPHSHFYYDTDRNK
jgi:hypothetical protein